MAIYTRTGDKGTTSLFNGQRVSKDDLRVEAYGTIDELNSAIGVVLAEVQNSPLRPASAKASAGGQGFAGQAKVKSELEKIQNDLLDIGSSLANPSLTHNSQPITLNSRVKDFERFIDQMTAKMPPLSNFILPGGGKVGSFLHLARAVSRRAERKIVALNNKQKIDNNIIIYLNRLSDLLFTMARFANFKEKRKEVIWIKRK